MVKLFFGGVAVFVFVVVGAFAALFTPLMGGVDRNLGGSPKSPFHSPVPQPVVDTVNGLLGRATPPVLLIGALAIAALLCVYTIGALASQMLRSSRERRARLAELRAQGRIMAAREQAAQESTHHAETPLSTTELEAMWE